MSSLLDNLVALVLLLVFSFLLLHSLPGSQADVLLASDLIPGASASDYAETEQQLGLDQPLPLQFWQWLQAVGQGDLGYSMTYSASVSSVLGGALPWTLTLALISLPVSLFSGSLLGLAAGMHPKRLLSRFLLVVMTLLNSVPGFVVALLLLGVFAVGLDWFPSAGGSSMAARLGGHASFADLAYHAILPLLALSIHGSVRYFYLSYGLAQQIGRRPFIRYARLRGIRGWRLLSRWYLPNAGPELLSRLTSSLPGPG